MTIVVSGGGTGGHITPALAVAREIKSLHPEARIVYIAQRGEKFAHLLKNQPELEVVHTIFAGKFRRYHGQSTLKHLLDVKTNLLNIRDAFFIMLGILQSFVLIPRLRPDVIFLKGGFVCVPVGLAAAFWHKKFVTHDSDALPGLANRIVGKWATLHAVGMPKEVYNYDQNKTHFVGVPVSAEYKPVTPELQQNYRQETGLPPGVPIVLVTGGSLGAQRLNDVFRKIAPELLTENPTLNMVLVVGPLHETAERAAYGAMPPELAGRVHILGFTTKLHQYTGAADVVVTRAGATTVAELALQRRASIIIPNPLLAGGHQLKNAEALERSHAVITVNEKTMVDRPGELKRTISELIHNDSARAELGRNLGELAKADAAKDIAKLVTNLATGQGGADTNAIADTKGTVQ